MKPSRDRIPTGPDYADLLCGLACEFAVTRSVRDAAALLETVAGGDVGAPGLPVPPHRPYREEAATSPGRLRIAWTTTPASGAKIDPECEKAVRETVRLLESLGHILSEDRPRYDWEAFLENIHVIWTTFTAFAVDDVARSLNRKPGPANLEAVTLACYEDGKRYTAVNLLNAMAHGTHFTTSRRILPKRRYPCDSDSGAPPGAFGRSESKSGGHDSNGMDTAGFQLCSIHSALQFDRATGYFAPSPLERKRSPCGRTDRWPFRRRSHPAALGCST